jgi:hypothetical protein
VKRGLSGQRAAPSAARDIVSGSAAKTLKPSIATLASAATSAPGLCGRLRRTTVKSLVAGTSSASVNASTASLKRVAARATPRKPSSVSRAVSGTSGPAGAFVTNHVIMTVSRASEAGAGSAWADVARPEMRRKSSAA